MPKEKKQYMNYSEVEMNNDVVARMRENIIFPRRQACDTINKKWGLNIDVEWRNDAFFEVMDPDVASKEDPVSTPEEGEENE